MGTWVRLGLFVVLLAVGGAVLLFVPLPTIDEVRAWATAGGTWVLLAFIGGYAVVTLLPLPKNVLSAAAGLAFGLSTGAVVVWLAAIIGAVAAFGLGRILGRDGVRRLAGRHLERLDGLVRKHGVVAVLIARLVPVVPFTAVNYGSGLTAVGFPAYLVATAVGIVPGTIAYVAVGAYGTDPGNWPFLLAVGALIALSLGGAWLARRRSHENTHTDSPDPKEWNHA
ncbi:MAG: TVP38/TMEM64 family protein [Nakamurella sp.]